MRNSYPVFFPRIPSSLLRFASSRNGSIAIIAAAVFFTMSAVFSLSLDIGILYVSKQELQTAADLSALKAVTNPSRADELVLDVLEANGLSDSLSEDPELTWGSFPPTGYTMDTVTSLPVDDRFEEGGAGANALRVTLADVPRLYLVNLFFDANVQVSARAVAANLPLTQLFIRSYLAAFDSDRATVFNGLLSSYLGTSANLTAVGYNGLADADVSLIGFLDALAAGAGISAGDYDAVLAEEVTYPEMAAAAVTAMNEDDDFSGDVATVTAALQSLSADLSTVPTAALGDYLSLDADDPQKAAAARFNLLDLVVASSEAANAEHGLTSEVSIPIAGGAVSLSAAVVEPGQMTAVGGVGITAETSQTRLYLVVEPTQVLTLLGTDFDVRLPLLIESTKGTATVTDISCPTPLPDDATVAVSATSSALDTSVVDIDTAQLGEATTPVTQPGEIVDVGGLLTVTATAEVNYGSGSSNLTFTAPFDMDNFQTVSMTAPVSSAGSSLFSSLSYDVDVLGLPLVTDAMVVNALEPIVDAVAPGVDGLLDDVFEALGVSIGNTDVGVPYVRCSNPTLIL